MDSQEMSCAPSKEVAVVVVPVTATITAYTWGAGSQM